MSDSILATIQKEYPRIDKAAGEFLPKLTVADIRKDVMLAAEMCGLKLLRAAKVDLSAIPAGTPVLGLVPDETYDLMEDFIMGWAESNGLSPDSASAEIQKDSMSYLPEVIQYEKIFDKLCEKSAIAKELVPYVGATAALKLVAASKDTKGMPADVGLSMVIYHIIAGSKTAPFR